MKSGIRSILLACCLALVSISVAQQGLVSPIGGWKSYLSYASTREITQRGDELFVITSGGLYTYNLLDEHITTYSTVDGLSSIEATTIYTDPASGLVFVGYSDGQINAFDADMRISYISDISRSDLFTTKGITRMTSANGLLYIATQFGVVVYDLQRRETSYSITKVGTNPGGSAVGGLCIAEGRLWLAMNNLGIWSADMSVQNLGQPDNWRLESGTNGLPNVPAQSLLHAQGQIFALLGDSIYARPNGGTWSHSVFPNADYNYLSSHQDYITACYKPSFVALLSPDGNLTTLDRDGTVTSAWYTSGTTYVGDANVGISREYPGFTYVSFAPPGPRNNFVTDLAAGDGGLYIAPRGKKGASDRYYDKSGIPFFNSFSGKWHVYDHRNGDLVIGGVWQDFARAVYDKKNQHCIVGSWGEGVVVVDSSKVIATYTSTNSGLTWTPGIGHRVSGVALDDVGNIWITQILGDYLLNVLTPDSQWYAFDPLPGTIPVGITTDGYGNKWIIDQDEGLVIFNDNYTPADRSDDQVRTLTSAYGNGGLPNNSVRCLAIDHDQQMWIGTTDGVTILYDPSILWSNDFQDAACPIIDGYCLLRGQEVFDIAVDGANRKWIATNNGVYLINLDGTALLAHFTTDNSPLMENEVVAVTIDQSTGEVFFGTNQGVISFMGNSIEGLEDAGSLYVFPNPVPWDHEGPVMIKGMRQYSRIKIATVAGQVVRELDSFGGEVPWDGLDAFGRKVNPGIYVVMVADPDRQGAGIVKFAILERPE